MSKRYADEGSQKKRKVFYISLLAADKKGRPRNAYFTFDLMSKLDMKNTEVKVLDVHDLIEEYKKHHNGQIGEDITVYELVDDLIDHNLDGDFFLDECPFPAEDEDFEDFEDFDSTYDSKSDLISKYQISIFINY